MKRPGDNLAAVATVRTWRIVYLREGTVYRNRYIKTGGIQFIEIIRHGMRPRSRGCIVPMRAARIMVGDLNGNVSALAEAQHKITRTTQ